nr:hypothetical protein [Desulfobulbaceae bacterium]
MKQLRSSILLSLCILTACVAKDTDTTEIQQIDRQISTIAILPVVSVAEKSDSFSYSQLKKQERGVEVLTEIVYDYFTDYNNITILNDEKVDSFDVSYTANRTAQALSIAKNLGADAVMTINMNRYIDRDGGKYSVQHPASVSFDYRLMHAGNGQTLCSGVYDETQKSLTDNLLSFKSIFKRKLQWVTAEELAREGIFATFGDCKYLFKPKLD